MLMEETDIKLIAQSTAIVVCFQCLHRVPQESITWASDVVWEMREVVLKGSVV